MTYGLLDLEERVEAIELVGEASAQHDAPESIEQRSTPLDYTAPIDLAPDLREIANRLSAGGLADGDFNEFLANARDAGLTSYAGPEDVPTEILATLEGFFTLSRAHVGVINIEQKLFVQDLVSAAWDRGDFVETDRASRTGIGDVNAGPGVLHVINDDDRDVYRVFRFPAEEYPDLESFERLRENVRDHLVRDVDRLLASGRGEG